MAGETKQAAFQGWNLTRSEINELILKPVFVSNSPLSNNFRVLKNVKDKAKMYFLGAPSKFIQNSDNCEFTPKGKLPLTPREIAVCRLKIEMKQCADEVFDTCWEKVLTGQGDGIWDPNATPEAKQLQSAMAEQVAKGIANDLFLISSFANPGATEADGFYDRCEKGLFPNLDLDVAQGKLVLLNANSGSALSSGDSVALFEALWANRKLDFIGFENEPAMHEIHVTHDIKENYRKYLQALGTEQAHTLIVEGVGSFLTWNGIPIYAHPEWDAELRNSFSLTQPHRAILTFANNLTVATDLTSQDVSLRIYTDVHQKEVFTQGNLRFGGAKLAFPDLAVYAK